MVWYRREARQRKQKELRGKLTEGCVMKVRKVMKGRQWSKERS